MVTKAIKKRKKRKTTKKSSNRKAAKKRTSNKKVIRPNCYYLHTAKLKIMAAVPIMPTTVISKDRHGRLFAHTQAEEVYKVYREQCLKHGLVTRRIEGMAFDSECPGLKRSDDGERWLDCKKPCVRYEGKWEICHVDSGETEIFCGGGDGNNEVWSINSAQTVAKKCGLLDYFEVAWPQPTDWLKVIKDSVEALPSEELHKALKEIIPAKIMTATSIGEELCNYFDSVLAKHQKG